MIHTIEAHKSNYGELRAWADCVNRTLISLDFGGRTTDFSGSYHHMTSGDCVAARLFGTAHRTTRSLNKVRSSDNDFVLLQYNRTGSAHLTHRRFDGLVGPGTFFALDASKPHVLDMGESFDHLAIRMPMARFISLHPAVGGLLDKPIDCRTPELTAAASILDMAASLGGAVPGALTTMTETVVKLLGEWLASSDDDNQDRNLHQALLERRVLKTIDEHFVDPNFSATRLAELVGVSRRYIDMILASANTTFGKAVLERRLDRCHNMLTNNRYGGKSITDIAFDTGFNDLSHFSKRFRERFGISPRMARNGSGTQPTEH